MHATRQIQASSTADSGLLLLNSPSHEREISFCDSNHPVLSLRESNDGFSNKSNTVMNPLSWGKYRYEKTHVAIEVSASLRTSHCPTIINPGYFDNCHFIQH